MPIEPLVPKKPLTAIAMFVLSALLFVVAPVGAASALTDDQNDLPDECTIEEEDPICEEDEEDEEQEEDDNWCPVIDECIGEPPPPPPPPPDPWPPPGWDWSDFPDPFPIDPTPPGPCKLGCHQSEPGPGLDWPPLDW